MNRVLAGAVATLALAVGCGVVAGCTVTGPPCTNQANCEVVVTQSNGNPVFSRTELPPPPSPSFPAAALAQCKTAGGTPDTYGPNDANQYAYQCDHVNYVGSDGADYYTDIPVTSSGTLATASTAGTGATESECLRGYYPDASTGNPDGIPGKWDAAVGLCSPTVTTGYQDQLRH